jgi:hypothetical protein
VGRAVRRDLREVRDAEDLEASRQTLKPGSDDVGDRATDSGVHFVEDEGLAGRVGRGQRLEREHDPGELPAGGNPRERFHVLAGIRRDIELRLLNAPFRPLRLPLRGRKPDLTARAAHRKVGKRLLERPAERLRGSHPLAGQQPGGLEVCVGSLAQVAVQRRGSFGRVLDVV